MNTSVTCFIPEDKHFGTPKQASIQDKLNFLASLRGLTCAERDLIARWRAADAVPQREAGIFVHIWRKHSAKWDKV